MEAGVAWGACSVKDIVMVNWLLRMMGGSWTPKFYLEIGYIMGYSNKALDLFRDYLLSKYIFLLSITFVVDFSAQIHPSVLISRLRLCKGSIDGYSIVKVLQSGYQKGGHQKP